MSRSSSSPAPLIKGYLPVRVKIPSSASERDETFFFVKEHRDGNTSKVNETKDTGNNKKKKGATLFVVNAPTVPLVRTRLLLKSLLGRFGEVSRVTVVPNPRHAQQEADELHQQSTLWTTKFGLPSFLPPAYSEGKFAHVVFASPKEMRRALRALTEIMSSPSSSSSDGNTLPGLTLDRVEIQTLADESDRQLREERTMAKADEDTTWNVDDDNDALPDSSNPQSAVVRLAERYQASLYSRDSLLEECNNVMEQFETAEEEDRLAREAAANQPDDDGFVTVTYSSQVGSKRELEESNNGQGRKKGQKRSRSKKKGYSGASELQDFYRFQTKEKRKKSLQELRRRFEDDLAKVKKMKEEKQYRPF